MSIVKDNVNIIRDQIAAKVQSKPFMASQNAVDLTVTDFDTFPYPRYYRGIYQLSEPVVLEREAGWRRRYDNCYNPDRIVPEETMEMCWQVPCSTVFPCHKCSVKKSTIVMGPRGNRVDIISKASTGSGKSLLHSPEAVHLAQRNCCIYISP